MNEQHSVLKQVGLMALSAAVLIGLIYLVAVAGGNNNESSNTPGAGGVVLTVPPSAEDWSIGNPDAKVTLVEYGDYQCPACGAYHPLVKQLTEELKNDVRFVFRHYPLNQVHRNAMNGALAAEAAGKQGKFWEMHNMIFEKQSEWSDKNNAEAREVMAGYARSLGLDENQFKADMDNNDLRTKILSQYQTGSDSTVNSTPTFFINGEKIANPRGYDDFKNTINEYLKK